MLSSRRNESSSKSEGYFERLSISCSLTDMILIYALYFCPQLYTKKDGALVALTGPEIGQLMAHALEGAAIEKPPWYEPSNGAPKEPVINSSPEMEFDSLVVDAPATRASKPTALHSVAAPDKQKTAT